MEDESSPMEKTAQFFNPRRKIPMLNMAKKLKPLNPELQNNDFDMPTFSRKINQKEIFSFGDEIQQQLSKYNSQPNILKPNSNFSNISLLKFRQSTTKLQTPLKSLLGTQQVILPPKRASDHLSQPNISRKQTPEKGRRNIKVLLNPFNMDQRSTKETINSSSSMRPSKSQGKSFLQRKAQIGLLNRIFSSRSQDQL